MAECGCYKYSKIPGAVKQGLQYMHLRPKNMLKQAYRPVTSLNSEPSLKVPDFTISLFGMQFMSLFLFLPHYSSFDFSFYLLALGRQVGMPKNRNRKEWSDNETEKKRE